MKWYLVLLTGSPDVKKVSAEQALKMLDDRELEEDCMKVVPVFYPYQADIRAIALDSYCILVRWS